MLKRDNAPEACFYLQDERKICKLADSSDVIPAATRKEPQCLYRVLNILFYDRFDEGFAQLGNVADLAALDASIQQSTFWEGVQEAFEGQEDVYNNMHFADDEVFSELHYIKPGK